MYFLSIDVVVATYVDKNNLVFFVIDVKNQANVWVDSSRPKTIEMTVKAMEFEVWMMRIYLKKLKRCAHGPAKVWASFE